MGPQLPSLYLPWKAEVPPQERQAKKTRSHCPLSAPGAVAQRFYRGEQAVPKNRAPKLSRKELTLFETVWKNSSLKMLSKTMEIDLILPNWERISQWLSFSSLCVHVCKCVCNISLLYSWILTHICKRYLSSHWSIKCLAFFPEYW